MRLTRLLSFCRGFGSSLIRPSVRTKTLGIMVCVCAMLIGTEVWQLWRVYDANIQQTEAITSNTAQLLAEQAKTTLKTADTIVASLVERVEAEGTGPEAKTRLYHLMTSLAAALPAIHEMGIMDSHGDAVVKSLVANTAGLNYADREYFRHHATHPDSEPFIGERIRSKIDGASSITVTRRFDRPDGSFGGVVVTSVSLTFFQRLFDEMQAKSGGVISLLADDGTILVRSPAVPQGPTVSGGSFRQQMLAQAEAGSLSYRSTVDGVKRVGSYRHLNQFPLSTVVSQSAWDLQAPLRAELASHAVILACVMVVVIGLGGRAITATNMLAEQAMQDGLTGLANRRCFDHRIEQEVQRAARSGHAVSVIMIDIDHFKDYNDCFGHPAGDDCLRIVGTTIQGCLRRAGDFAARYGGEEIAVLLPECDGREAVAVAERMRLAVRGLAVRQASYIGDVVTFSAGVVTRLPGREAGEAQALVEMADTALYAAKAAGRNRVVSSGTAASVRCAETKEPVPLPSPA